ncbi:hypothetical protein CSUI_008038 [Cystoisospora suis]|uniref:Uncharacterized protein n=1 Tax=Cystoisospora suis TaxID=483139 RepID=A0A2C6KNP2_9APIC|nr:hypothetical protein CSUI_008038 [Cystoisospora suis]
MAFLAFWPWSCYVHTINTHAAFFSAIDRACHYMESNIVEGGVCSSTFRAASLIPSSRLLMVVTLPVKSLSSQVYV